MKLFKQIQSALQLTNAWATFLRVAYIGYVLGVVWIAATTAADELSGTDYAVDALLGGALPIVMTILLLTLVLHYHYLPKTVGGMFHMFLPAVFLVFNFFITPGTISLIEVSLIHLGAVFIAYPVWLFRAFVTEAKGPLTGRIANFMFQFFFFLLIVNVLSLLARGYIQYWQEQVLSNGQQWQMWLSLGMILVLLIDQIFQYLRTALREARA